VGTAPSGKWGGASVIMWFVDGRCTCRFCGVMVVVVGYTAATSTHNALWRAVKARRRGYMGLWIFMNWRGGF